MTQNFDHEPIVVIGECKTNGEMSEDEITRLLTIVEKLSGIGVKPFIVFSKAGSPFTTQELEVIDRHQTIDLNFILLAPRELEPYDPICVY